MIHKVLCTFDKKVVREVKFVAGVNLVVAERSKTATDKDSRNGLGKTTLFRIIDFCLGSDVNKKGTLQAKQLPGWEFSLELDIRDRRISVTRAVDDDKVVRIAGDVSGWPIPTNELGLDGWVSYSLEDWKKIVGWAFFDLPAQKKSERETFSMPSARTLLHFFIRKTFDDPLYPVKVAKLDTLTISYLLGLNWEYISQLNEVKSKEKEAGTIKAAANLELKRWLKTEKVLQTECRALESMMNDIKTQLQDFNVLPGYAEIEEKVNKLTIEIHALKNKVISEQSRLNVAKGQLIRVRNELKPVNELYEKCGLVFPDAVRERLENVQAFHEAVTGNRRLILDRETRRLQASIDAANAQVLAKSEEKRAAMGILKTGGALEEYTKLNQRYTDMARDLQSKLDCLRRLNEAKNSLNSLKEKKVEIAAVARNEYEELRSVWDESEKFFNNLTQEFYQTPGTLGIELMGENKKWGFKFEPHIPSDESGGIMTISFFSFDMTVFHQQRVCNRMMDFIIHDSTLFESPDPRQSGKALAAAIRITEKLGGQYICAINSDKLDTNEFKEFIPKDVSNSLTALTLSDESEDTKLLRCYFGRSTKKAAEKKDDTKTTEAKETQPPAE
jgi:uncharacterized protein YydD (DUF2326 family)